MPIVSIASGLLDHSAFGKLQGPLASYIERFAGIEKPEEQLWGKVFREKKSNHWGENYTSRTDIEDMVPGPEGADYPSTSFQDGYTRQITNVEFLQSISITQTAIEDDVMGDLKQQADSLMRAYHRGKARLAAAFVGQSLQGQTEYVKKGWRFDLRCMDGGCVFDTAHKPKVFGANQSNLYADAFSADALTAGMLKMRDLKDEDGNTLDIDADTIIIPANRPVLYNAVLTAVASLQKPGSSNNDVNIHHGNWDILVSSYLNDHIPAGASPWILFDSKFNQAADGNVFQNRVPFNVRSEIERNNVNTWFARARYNYGFVNWRQMMAFGVNGGSSL